MKRPKYLHLAMCARLRKRLLLVITPLLLLLVPGSYELTTAAGPTNSLQDQITDVQMEMDKAIAQVQKIVNQPVVAYARQPGMQYSEYSPGWFHEGASKPDFNSVDIRTTQQFPYASHEYVTSDLNPGVVFRGRDLEFNSNTKYFYLNRSIPKKKLTEAEMLEVNRLYRIIGHCEHELLVLQPPPVPQPPEQTAGEKMLDRFPILSSTSGRVTLGAVIFLGLAFLIGRRLVRR